MSDSGNCDVPLPPEQGNKQNDSVVRTRIASVLFALNAGEDWNMEPLVWEEISESYRECWLKQADAVIHELGLPPTWGKPSFENGNADD